jgi:hypothetical protein
MKPQPKPERITDKKYLKWIRKMPCVVTGRIGKDPDTGESLNDYHHVNPDGHGGVATKCSDYRALPLIHEKHVEAHNAGKRTFARRNALDYEHWIKFLNELWEDVNGKRD